MTESLIEIYDNLSNRARNVTSIFVFQIESSKSSRFNALIINYLNNSFFSSISKELSVPVRLKNHNLIRLKRKERKTTGFTVTRKRAANYVFCCIIPNVVFTQEQSCFEKLTRHFQAGGLNSTCFNTLAKKSVSVLFIRFCAFIFLLSFIIKHFFTSMIVICAIVLNSSVRYDERDDGFKKQFIRTFFRFLHILYMREKNTYDLRIISLIQSYE